MVELLAKNGIYEKEDSWSQFLLPVLLVVITLPLLTAFGLLFSLLISVFIPIENEFLFDYITSFLAQIGGFLFMSLISKFFIRDTWKPSPFLHRKKIDKTIRIFSMGFTFYFFVNLSVITIMSQIGAEPKNVYEAIVPSDPTNITPSTIFLLFCTTIIGAPLYEEYIFRRLLIPALKRRGLDNLGAALASSLAFALVHTPNNILNGNLSFVISHFIASFIIGFIASTAFIITQDFIAPVIIHFLFNLIGTVGLVIDLISDNEIYNIFVIYLGLITLIIIILGIIFAIVMVIRYFGRQKTILSPLKADPPTKRFKIGLTYYFILFIGIMFIINLIELGLIEISDRILRLSIILIFEILLIAGIILIIKNLASSKISLDLQKKDRTEQTDELDPFKS